MCECTALPPPHLRSSMRALAGTPLGHSDRDTLKSLSYFRNNIATVERREARVPRHGTRRASLSAEVAPRKRDNNISAPVGAPLAPRWVGCEETKTNPAADTRRGNEEQLRCLTSLVETTANGSFASRRSLVSRASAARHRSRACPRSAVRRRKSGKPDLRGPRGDTTDRSQQPYCASRVVALGPGSRSVRLRLSALGRDTRAPHSSLPNPRCIWSNEATLQKRNAEPGGD